MSHRPRRGAAAVGHTPDLSNTEQGESAGTDLPPPQVPQEDQDVEEPEQDTALRREGETPASSMREQTDADIDELYAQLRTQVRRKRRLAEIESLREELADGEPSNPIEIDGTMLPARKRVAVDETEAALLKLLQHSDPPTFSGKNIKELQTYHVGWSNLFKPLPPIAEDAYARRIAIAATRLRSVAAQAWERNTVVFQKWDDYYKFLRNVIADPAIRQSEALVQLATKRQKEKQTVRELLAEIENLEQDIPPMTTQERRAWTLLNALKPAIRAEVIRENRTITTREAVLVSAQRHEEILKHQTKAEEQSSQETSKRGAGASQGKHKRSSGTAAKDSKKSEGKPSLTPKPPSSSDTPEDSCFNCGKKGHFAKDCRSAPKGDSDKSAASEHAKSKGYGKGKEKAKN